MQLIDNFSWLIPLVVAHTFNKLFVCILLIFRLQECPNSIPFGKTHPLPDRVKHFMGCSHLFYAVKTVFGNVIDIHSARRITAKNGASRLKPWTILVKLCSRCNVGFGHS